MAICEYCGKQYEQIHMKMKYCSSKCRHATQWRSRQAEANKSANIKPEKYSRKERQVIITDAEQREIDKAVFIKTAVTYEQPKVYRPGDPEFEQIARTVTPIEKIPTKKIIYRGINNA